MTVDTPNPNPESETLQPAPATTAQRLTAVAARVFIRLLGSTMRVREIGREHLEAARRSAAGGRVAFAFWHGHQFPLVHTWRRRGVAILTSLSRDGTLQSLVLGGLGYYIIRGSASRGAVRGLVGIIRTVKEGRDCAFAVDGPRGPYHEVKPGVLFTAQKTGSAIVPITCSVRRARIFTRAWDRYILPWPLTRVVVAYGESLPVPPGTAPEEIEALGTELARRLDELTASAEAAL